MNGQEAENVLEFKPTEVRLLNSEMIIENMDTNWLLIT